MHNTYIIGMAGFARAGKDTAAVPLMDERFERLAFADGVRALAYELNPFVKIPKSRGLPTLLKYRECLELWGYEGTKDRTLAREELVAIGAGVRKVIGPDAWVAAVETQIEEGGSYVVTDVRYANEVAMIERLGGETWVIERPEVGPANDEERRSMEDVYGHRYISNTSTIGELQTAARDALSDFYKTRGGLGFNVVTTPPGAAYEHRHDAGMNYDEGLRPEIHP